MRSEQRACPCGSGKGYELCCQPFHKGKGVEDVADLVRARYSAYALDLPEYIIRTTHPASPRYLADRLAWKKQIARFSKKTRFQRLILLKVRESGVLAEVTFTAELRSGHQDGTFTEKSLFEKKGNEWFYRGGSLIEGHAPHLVTHDQLRMLPLAYYGEPILQRPAEAITEVTNELRGLIEQMIETMDACDGIGIAAPQVHLSIRLFVLRVPRLVGTDQYEFGEIKVFINPVLTDPSEETNVSTEGCLSIPTIRGNVERPDAITVTYMNLSGESITERVDGLEARIIMHETDHLNGVLFIDRLSKRERESIDDSLRNLKKRIHDGKAF